MGFCQAPASLSELARADKAYAKTKLIPKAYKSRWAYSFIYIYIYIYIYAREMCLHTCIHTYIHTYLSPCSWLVRKRLTECILSALDAYVVPRLHVASVRLQSSVSGLMLTFFDLCYCATCIKFFRGYYVGDDGTTLLSFL